MPGAGPRSPLDFDARTHRVAHRTPALHRAPAPHLLTVQPACAEKSSAIAAAHRQGPCCALSSPRSPALPSGLFFVTWNTRETAHPRDWPAQGPASPGCRPRQGSSQFCRGRSGWVSPRGHQGASRPCALLRGKTRLLAISASTDQPPGLWPLPPTAEPARVVPRGVSRPTPCAAGRQRAPCTCKDSCDWSGRTWPIRSAYDGQWFSTAGEGWSGRVRRDGPKDLRGCLTWTPQTACPCSVLI